MQLVHWQQYANNPQYNSLKPHQWSLVGYTARSRKAHRFSSERQLVVPNSSISRTRIYLIGIQRLLEIQWTNDVFYH